LRTKCANTGIFGARSFGLIDEAEPVRAAKLPFALNPVNLEFFWRFAPGLAEYGIDTLSRSRPREPALFFETN
jgi:hypothetical protein